MGTHFVIEALRPQDDGTLVSLKGDDAKFSVNNSSVFRFIDAIEDRRWREKKSLFPWYRHSFDGIGKPKVENCFKPKEVLSSIQGIERELTRNANKYRAEWLLWETLPDGTRRSHKQLDATYKEKPCRLYSDEKGCWAQVLDSPDKYKPNYDLSETPMVSVEADGRTVELRLERISLLALSQKALNGIRKVCLRAWQEDALVLTMILH